MTKLSELLKQVKNLEIKTKNLEKVWNQEPTDLDLEVEA